jgi:hypothetical protein
MAAPFGSRSNSTCELERSEQPPAKPTDWAQPVKIGCRCADCRELEAFAASPGERVHRFRVRKERRPHLHQAIERYGLDMTHETERIGSPQTLVCTKTRRSYQQRCEQHGRDLKSLQALVALFGKTRPPEFDALLERVSAAISRAGR